MKNRKAKKGFTIIELVIVIAVIGILAAVLIPTFSGVIDNAKKSAAQSNASTAYQQYVFDEISKENSSYDQATDNFYIVSGDYYFTVTKGQFDSTANEGDVPQTEGFETMYISGNTLSKNKPASSGSDTTGSN